MKTSRIFALIASILGAQSAVAFEKIGIEFFDAPFKPGQPKVVYADANATKASLEFGFDCGKYQVKGVPKGFISIDTFIRLTLTTLNRKDEYERDYQYYKIATAPSGAVLVAAYYKASKTFKTDDDIHRTLPYVIQNGRVSNPDGNSSRAFEYAAACAQVYGPRQEQKSTEPGKDQKAERQPQGEVKRLMTVQETLNSKCRGGSGNLPSTWDACDEREKVGAQIKKMGWCWGPDDAPGYQQHWIPCRDPANTGAQAR